MCMHTYVLDVQYVFVYKFALLSVVHVIDVLVSSKSCTVCSQCYTVCTFIHSASSKCTIHMYVSIACIRVHFLY